MKSIITKILVPMAFVAGLFVSCQQPEDLIPAESRNGINSLTASFPNDTRDENEFKAEIDYENGRITVVFPYTYPANSTSHLEASDLQKVRVEANLDDNAICEPALLFMDLSKENHITITDQRKQKKDYVVVGEIRKSNLCAIESFGIPAKGLSAVINEGTKVISIVADEAVGSQLASAELSFGASFKGLDPTKTSVDYDAENINFTVVAQDGKTEATYKVEVATPDILAKGLRDGSEKFLWETNIKDLGIGNILMTTGMAVTKNYVVLNTRGEDLVYVNRKDGTLAGTIALDFKGSLTNFYCTADFADNILVSNLTPNAGNDLVIYRIKGVTGTPEEYIRYNAGGDAYGRKLSVIGDLDGDAVITAPLYVSTPSFLKWTVTGGVLNPTPEKITIDPGRFVQAWNYNADVAMIDITSANSDYLLACYAGIDGGDRFHVWANGTDNTIKYKSKEISANWVPNAVDIVEFNHVKYAVMNTVNSFTWGADDVVYLYDLSLDSLDTPIWNCDKGLYGGFAVNATANANSNGDVALRVSDNGYFLHLYFFFGAGKLVSVQFDCLKM